MEVPIAEITILLTLSILALLIVVGINIFLINQKEKKLLSEIQLTSIKNKK